MKSCLAYYPRVVSSPLVFLARSIVSSTTGLVHKREKWANRRIAVLLAAVISMTLPAAVVSAQSAKRGGGKQRNDSSKPTTPARVETLKICQGIPVPVGYVIIAYMTSSTCPHGMYILKKQDQYSDSSPIVKRIERRTTGTTASDSQNSPAAVKPADASGTAAKAESEKQNNDAGVDPFANPPQVTPTTSSDQQTATAAGQQPADSSQASVTFGSGMRPRRVTTSASQNEIASPTNDQPELPARPPRWAGTAPSGSPVVASSSAVSAPGPEEVSEGDVVRIDTALVTVPVSVLDRQGRFIPDLRREDFKVFENGVEQSVAYFEPADKPFTVALLLDTSPSTHFHLWEIKEAAIAFARQLRPQDRVLIVSFNEQVLLLTEVTNDLNIINTVIEHNANTGTATRVYDAVSLVIKERLNKIKGRKAIVLFSDGVDTASYLSTYESTIREVEELDALIYPIQYDTTDYLRAIQGAGSTTVVTTTSNGPFGTTTSRVTYGGPPTTSTGAPLPGSTKADYDRADQYLRELAEKTAGRLYKANDTTQLAQAFSRIAEELRRQYSLGYYPQSGAIDSERRQIRVRVNRPNVAVRARDGYVRSTAASSAK
jgi:VWFA-related protein